MAVETRLIRLDPDAPEEALLAEAGAVIRAGGLVAFPTETVYGLGGDALNAESSRRIYAAKGRPSDNPLIVHIARREDLARVADASRIPETAWRLAEAFWPGPLTMVLWADDCIPRQTTGGLDTVAVRFPSDRIAQGLIRAGGGFIAAPSANRSGRPSPTTAAHCLEDLDGRVEMILDGGQSTIGLESTIVDLTEADGIVTILRPGYVTREALAAVPGIAGVRLDPALEKQTGVPDEVRPKAPGMKYRHYAPKGALTIVMGDPMAVSQYINTSISTARAAGKRTGVLASAETSDSYAADLVCNIGARGDEEAAAHTLFGALRACDEAGIEVICAEAPGDGTSGLSAAVMNRLLKAAGYHVIKV
ncbi:MAG: threonylcarbamoyl-AMP synthase [Butyrivibrio sp.]|nr:threonylcarbamoyl-AMP synthase [Butyrivibrio sp.]